MVTTGAVRRAKLQSKCHQQQTSTQLFYKPDTLPVGQPTVSEHCSLIIIMPCRGKDFPVFRGSQRDELSVPEMFSAGAAFQRSFTVQQFACL